MNYGRLFCNSRFFLGFLPLLCSAQTVFSLHQARSVNWGRRRCNIGLCRRFARPKPCFPCTRQGAWIGGGAGATSVCAIASLGQNRVFLAPGKERGLGEAQVQHRFVPLLRSAQTVFSLLYFVLFYKIIQAGWK